MRVDGAEMDWGEAVTPASSTPPLFVMLIGTFGRLFCVEETISAIISVD